MEEEMIPKRLLIGNSTTQKQHKDKMGGRRPE
jgi:hypothetical protein